MNRSAKIIAVVAIVIIVVLAATFIQELKTRNTMDELRLKLGEDTQSARDRTKQICADNFDRALQVLFKAAVDENATRQKNAIEIIGLHESDLKGNERDTAIKILTARLDDRDPGVRVKAAFALATKFKHAPAADKLEKMVEADSSMEVKQAALECLGHIGGEKEVTFLAARMKDSDKDFVKIGAARALGFTGRADALTKLLALLPEKLGLALQTEQLYAIAALAQDLKDSDHKKNVIEVLDKYASGDGLMMLLAQAEDQSGKIGSTKQQFYAALVKAYHDWGEGKHAADFLFDKLKASTLAEHKEYQDAINAYVVTLRTTGNITSGRHISVVTKISQEDTSLLLYICGKLLELFNADTKDFAADALNQITNLNLGDNLVEWQNHYRKWTDGTEKFKVDPLSISDMPEK